MNHYKKTTDTHLKVNFIYWAVLISLALNVLTLFTVNLILYSK